MPYIDIECCIRRDALAIVDVEGARSGALKIEGRDDAPWVFSGIPRRHGRLLGGDDVAAADEDWYMAERSVNGGVLAGDRVDGRLRVPVVPDGAALPDAGKDAVDRGRARRQDGNDHDSGSEKKLTVNGREGRIVWELPGQGPHDGAAGRVGEIEKRVHIREDLEADVHGCFGGVDDAGPGIGFLRVGSEGVVIPVKGEERRQLHPIEISALLHSFHPELQSHQRLQSSSSVLPLNPHVSKSQQVTIFVSQKFIKHWGFLRKDSWCPNTYLLQTWVCRTVKTRGLVGSRRTYKAIWSNYLHPSVRRILHCLRKWTGR